MRRDSRLSRMLHVLIHMSRHDGAATSEAISRMLNTNPVVVRRTMAGLRDQGIVRSEKGHGGGWVLARPLEELTLLDVYRALGEPIIFALGPADDRPACLVEQTVNAALGDALSAAEALLTARLGAVTLAELSSEFERRFHAVRGGSAAGPCG